METRVLPDSVADLMVEQLFSGRHPTQIDDISRRQFTAIFRTVPV